MAAVVSFAATNGKNTKWSGVEALLDDLRNIVNDSETGDVLFIVGDEELRIYAHRLILTTRCEFFRKRARDLWSKTYSPDSPYVINKPGFKPNIFREVMDFIYTGQIHFKHESAFEVLHIAEDLEISDLQMACEQFFMRNVDVQNAAAFLSDAMALSGGSGPNSNEQESKGARALVDKCIAFMEENAEEVVHTKGFCELPKPALIKLISSDKFAVSEDEVWRAVLKWAKNSTGINKPTSLWNEEDRKIILQELSGVIDYVKILLINSTVFAEEVEPTGIVPMELSLERYKFAAVPKSFHSPADPRLRPRVSSKLFHNSAILSQDKVKLQKALNCWYGDDNQEWKLLFRASRNGFSAKEFHNSCDGHSPTITLVKSTCGSICGGFSDQPWRSDCPQGRYISSDRAYLFSLVNSSGVENLVKFNIVKAKYATHHHPQFGPMFGAGADLCIGDNCNKEKTSYSNLPYSYASAKATSDLLMGEYYFTVDEYEVFALKGDNSLEKE